MHLRTSFSDSRVKIVLADLAELPKKKQKTKNAFENTGGRKMAP